MSVEKELSAFALAVILCCSIASGQATQIELRIDAPKAQCSGPVYAQITLPEQFASVPAEQICVTLREENGESVVGQVTNEGQKSYLYWLLPCERANTGTSWTAELERRDKASGFAWVDTPGKHLELLFNGRAVMQYVYERDKSTPQRDFETDKPFCNVFDLTGERLITNCDPNSLYPHHRGLFIGWQRVSCGDEDYDFWGMNKLLTAQEHQRFLEMTAGPVMARMTALINWNDNQGNTIIAEERKVTVFNQPAPSILLLEFTSTLKAVKDDVVLHSSNPAKAVEHGGIHYRAHNDVSGGKGRSSTHREPSEKTSSVKYLFHAEDVDPLKVFDLPWVAMSYSLNGKDYTVQYINHPSNPRPSFYSAYRDYGRFGAYFEKQIKAGESLTVVYWLWIAESRMPERSELAARYLSVIDAPQVQVISRTGR
jgi:hypothetical protein